MRPSSGSSSFAAFSAVVAVAATLGLATGCASQSERTRPLRMALDAGRPEAAVTFLDEEMKVPDADSLPHDLAGDDALLLLDRATVQQALSQYQRSKRDYEAADKAVDLLDLSENAGDTIGKYVFSDSSGKYVAPPYEKLLINTLNLLNYLETGDVDGALVEARRLSVMRTYVVERLGAKDDKIVALSGFLAGLAFERAGNRDEALRYYDEALAGATFGWLREPVRAMLSPSSYHTARLDALVEGMPPVSSTEKSGEGEVVVVIGFGRVPHKIANRIPIGLALTEFSGAISPTNRAAAQRLAAQGLVTWITFPTLGPEQGGYAMPTASLDGAPVVLEQALDVTSEVRKQWHGIEGKIVASAITRMIARFAAGEAARLAAGNGALGLLASLGTQATLVALDKPDTRSWETLPARFAVARVRLPAGKHRLHLSARGAFRDADVDVRAGGLQVVTLFALR